MIEPGIKILHEGHVETIIAIKPRAQEFLITYRYGWQLAKVHLDEIIPRDAIKINNIEKYIDTLVWWVSYKYDKVIHAEKTDIYLGDDLIESTNLSINLDLYGTFQYEFYSEKLKSCVKICEISGDKRTAWVELI